MNDSYLSTMVEAARLGGAIVRRYFGQALRITEKSMASDQQTQADVESEQAIIAHLHTAHPEVVIYAEESSPQDSVTDAPTFVIDPLDGTNNFVLGIPYFAVSIGLMVHQEIIAGVIYHPILDQTYAAEKDRGATLDGQPLRVSPETDPARLTVGWCGTYGGDFGNFLHLFNMTPRPKRRTNAWCPTLDLCLVARGTMEAMVMDGPDVYDFCAGKLIAREAGAVITDVDGNLETNDTNRFFIAGNTVEVCKYVSTYIHQT